MSNKVRPVYLRISKLEGQWGVLIPGDVIMGPFWNRNEALAYIESMDTQPEEPEKWSDFSDKPPDEPINTAEVMDWIGGLADDIKMVLERIDGLESRLDRRIDAAFEDISYSAEEINTIHSRLTDLEQAGDDRARLTDEVESVYDDVADHDREINRKVDAIAQRLGDRLDAAKALINGRIEEINERIDGIMRNDADVYEKLSHKLDTQVERLHRRIDARTGDVVDVREDIDRVEKESKAKFDALRDIMDARFIAAHGRIEEMEGQQDEIKGDVKDLDDLITYVRHSLGKYIDERCNTLSDRVGDNEKEISHLSSFSGEVRNDMETLRDHVDELFDDLDDRVEDIEAVYVSFRALRIHLDRIHTKIDSYEQDRLEALESIDERLNAISDRVSDNADSLIRLHEYQIAAEKRIDKLEDQDDE